jgi:hypothetical protein
LSGSIVYPFKIQVNYDEHTTHWSSSLFYIKDPTFFTRVQFPAKCPDMDMSQVQFYSHANGDLVFLNNDYDQIIQISKYKQEMLTPLPWKDNVTDPYIFNQSTHKLGLVKKSKLF